MSHLVGDKEITSLSFWRSIPTHGKLKTEAWSPTCWSNVSVKWKKYLLVASSFQNRRTKTKNTKSMKLKARITHWIIMGHFKMYCRIVSYDSDTFILIYSTFLFLIFIKKNEIPIIVLLHIFFYNTKNDFDK